MLLPNLSVSLHSYAPFSLQVEKYMIPTPNVEIEMLLVHMNECGQVKFLNDYCSLSLMLKYYFLK